MYSLPKIAKNILKNRKKWPFLAKKSGKMTILGYLFKNIFQLRIFLHFDWPLIWKCLRILGFLRIFHWGPKGKNIDWSTKKNLIKKLV